MKTEDEIKKIREEAKENMVTAADTKYLQGFIAALDWMVSKDDKEKEE